MIFNSNWLLTEKQCREMALEKQQRMRPPPPKLVFVAKLNEVNGNWTKCRDFGVSDRV
jgi:hypothetical protein